MRIEDTQIGAVVYSQARPVAVRSPAESDEPLGLPADDPQDRLASFAVERESEFPMVDRCVW